MLKAFDLLFTFFAIVLCVIGFSVFTLLIGDVITTEVFGFCLLDALFPLT